MVRISLCRRIPGRLRLAIASFVGAPLLPLQRTSGDEHKIRPPRWRQESEIISEAESRCDRALACADAISGGALALHLRALQDAQGRCDRENAADRAPLTAEQRARVSKSRRL
jgi:hypothetical protein